nr:MAG TPA: hypothetical protein [Caudoviricetes sp.]
MVIHFYRSAAVGAGVRLHILPPKYKKYRLR